VSLPLLAELKRRRVFRALVAYGIAAFAVLQIIEPVMHGMHWPDEVLSYVVVALAIGFPIVVSVAWIFDVRSSGIERTAPAPSASLRGARLAMLLVGIGALAAAPGLIWYFAIRGGTRDGARRSAAITPSIAVLPFVNMSSDKENEYFSDGITEELINALANVEGLRVSSRTSAFALKGKGLGIRKIGEELNVATVLEGSVRREGTSVRVTAQLVSAADGYHLWSKTYDRELKNIFALENELARSIAQALGPKLGAREPAPMVRPPTASTAAHDAYLKGRYFWNQRTREGLLKAISFFQQAIAEDPSYALAHAGLGDSYVLLTQGGSTPAAEQLLRAKEAVHRALELDGTLAEAHAALGLISMNEYDWSGAEREYRRAIELNPRYATAHHWYALFLSNTRPAEARTEIDRARQLDPTSPVINAASSLLHNLAREYPQAIEDANKALELDPHFAFARLNLANTYTQTRRYAEALAELDALERSDLSLGWRGYILAISGQRDAARRVLAELQGRVGRDVSPTSLAEVYAALGDKDAAFEWLDKAYAERDFRLGRLKVWPTWDPLRSDPRFARLLRRLQLE
jgi:TolB-like protein/Tfp pilus assembly protein PilF